MFDENVSERAWQTCIVCCVGPTKLTKLRDIDICSPQVVAKRTPRNRLTAKEPADELKAQAHRNPLKVGASDLILRATAVYKDIKV